MPIVDGNRRVTIGREIQGPRAGRGQSKTHANIDLRRYGHGQVILGSNRKNRSQKIIDDLATVKAHFNEPTNTHALEICLALTANAIRDGRLSLP